MPKSSRFAKRIVALRGRFLRFEYVCSGNLRRRYAVCGTKNCRCKAQPPALHGPYYYWSRMVGGKVVQRVLAPEDAEVVRKGIENYREARTLLRKWEEETVRDIETRKRARR
ncbi:MAG: DUF6788 family protein [Planctomycetota bacterium]